MSWLKFDCATPEKPEVLRITIAMGWEDPDLAVGKLLKVWRWFDAHSVDGNAAGVTLALLDRLIGVTGLAQAMVDAEWLCVTDAGLTLPNFENHNGKTAKDRALTAKRAANHRSNGKSNGPSVTSALPREEKRREDKDTAPDGFDEFWNAYPKKSAKPAAVRAFKSAKAKDELVALLAHVMTMSGSEDWTKEKGKYIPHPATYLNQRRWEDGGTSEAQPGLTNFGVYV